MDSIVDQYFPIVDALAEELQVLEEQIFSESFSRDTTAQVYELKRELLEVKSVVSPLIDICNRLSRFDMALIGEDTKLYFRDVYDHAIRINEMVDTLRELLTTALEASFAFISIAQNEVTKTFAGWAAIIAVPTMVAGIYGMNFDWMPELRWQYGYPVVMGLTVAACAGLYIHFKRSGWF
jgi:magnesium transporter